MPHHSTVRNARGGIEIDTQVPEYIRIAILQTKIDAANRLIFLGNLPTIVERGKQMEAEAVAKVWKVVNGKEL